MNVINTTKGDFFYEPIHLFHGRKRIDKDIARENLILLRSILITSGIRWGLIFGTLLGAVREGDFIDHDEDTDIYVFAEDGDKLLCLIPVLIEHGFTVARCGATLFSIIRKNEYIDFYFFSKKFSNRQAGTYLVPNDLFASSAQIQFLGFDFPTVNDPIAYLEYTYGADWRVPKLNSHAQGRAITLRGLIKKIAPRIVVKFYQQWRSK